MFCFVGAASPQAVKKLLALSEQSRTRPKGCPGPGHLHNHLLHSASPSPMAGRKDRGPNTPVCYHNSNGTGSNNNNNNNNNTTLPVTCSVTGLASPSGEKMALPVDLTAESSSVTSLPSIRKANHKNTGLKLLVFLVRSKD